MIITTTCYKKSRLIALILCLLAMLIGSNCAQAQSDPDSPLSGAGTLINNGTASDSPLSGSGTLTTTTTSSSGTISNTTSSSPCNTGFLPISPPNGQGIFTSIITQIITILNNLAYNMFSGISGDSSNGIGGDSGFHNAVSVALTLYVTIYGIMFTFGMVQITLYDFTMRMVKIAIVAMLVNGSAWQLFSTTVIPFFQNSTSTIINWVTSIAICPTCAPSNGPPLSVLDNAVASVVSPNMLVLLIATVTTLPYGPIIGLLLLLATKTFLQLIINALWVYAMALVMQTLLFGLAPIFLSFLLFRRTKHLFDGWLGQLVNSLLQPVL